MKADLGIISPSARESRRPRRERGGNGRLCHSVARCVQLTHVLFCVIQSINALYRASSRGVVSNFLGFVLAWGGCGDKNQFRRSRFRRRINVAGSDG